MNDAARVNRLQYGDSADMDEQALIARLRAGDERAFEMLVKQFGAAMMNAARRLLPSYQDSSDAVQEALISAFKSISRFEGTGGLGAWLNRITINCCLMAIRSRRRQPRAVGGNETSDSGLPRFDSTGHHAWPVPDWDNALDKLTAAETSARVRVCIDALDEPYRAVLLLRDIDQRSTEETARLTKTTVSNVKVRLHRARQMLRGRLERALLGPEK